MKFLSTKSIKGKLLIAILVVVLIFAFGIPIVSNANLITGTATTVIDIILNLFVALADGIMRLIQNVIVGTSDTFIEIDFGNQNTVRFWARVAAVVIAVVAIVVAVALIKTGIGAAKGILLLKKVGGAIKVAVTGAAIGGSVWFVSGFLMPQTFNLPLFSVGPGEIFSNQVDLLDVNFFNPPERGGVLIYIDADGNSNKAIVPVPEGMTGCAPGNQCEAGTDRCARCEFQAGHIGMYMVRDTNPDTPTDYIFRSPSIAGILRDQIGRWYQVLRSIALVGLLSVLVYTGIRVLLSSVASEKAKYKGMLQNWLVAMCLLFVLHYVMIFAVEVVGRISSAIVARSDILVYTIVDDPNAEEPRNIIERLTNPDYGQDGVSKMDMYGLPRDILVDLNEDGTYDVVAWPTNFMGQARIMLQEISPDGDGATTLRKTGYVLIYAALVLFTVFFLFYYLRRVLLLAFLTLIAPLIALTYPIDKFGDNKAQAFGFWFREYMFNLLIQPFHLILYFIIIGSVMTFASTNIIYACVALAFMMPAERLLRQIFGFEKSSTAGMNPLKAAALAGGGLAAVGKLLGHAGKNQNSEKIKMEDFSQEQIRMNDRDNPGVEDSESGLNFMSENGQDYGSGDINSGGIVSPIGIRGSQPEIGQQNDFTSDFGREMFLDDDDAMTPGGVILPGGVRNRKEMLKPKASVPKNSGIPQEGKKRPKLLAKSSKFRKGAKIAGGLAFRGAVGIHNAVPRMLRVTTGIAGAGIGAMAGLTAAIADGQTPGAAIKTVGLTTGSGALVGSLLSNTAIRAAGTAGSVASGIVTGAGGAIASARNYASEIDDTEYASDSPRIDYGDNTSDTPVMESGRSTSIPVMASGRYTPTPQEVENTARGEAFTENVAELNSGMDVVARGERAYSMSEIAHSTGIGVDGNKEDAKVLNKAASYRDTKRKAGMSPELAKRQADDIAELASKYSQKSYTKKEIEKHKDAAKEYLYEEHVKTNGRPESGAAKRKIENKIEKDVEEKFDVAMKGASE